MSSAAASMTSSTKEKLSQLLTPELFLKIYKLRFPWVSQTEPWDWDVVWNTMFGYSLEFSSEFYQTLYPNVWKPMSEMPLDELKKIELLDFVSGQDDAASYLEQCVGFVLSLDQTRQGISDGGTNGRYVNAFFDELTLPMAEKLLDTTTGIPPAHSPYSKDVWLKSGLSFDQWIASVTWLLAPLTHSEVFMAKHNVAWRGFLDYLRAEVEEYSGMSDPHRATETEDLKDVLLFSTIIMAPHPTKEDLGRDIVLADYAFWMIRLMKAHAPIIERFGRYPYRNDVVGRDFAPGEEEWMKSTGVFNRSRKEVREQIRKDVEEGTWTPLNPNPEYESSKTE